MLSCSTNSSLDRGACRSQLQNYNETLRLLRKLQKGPSHHCLGHRKYFKCPWKKGVITQVMKKEAMHCYAHIIRQVFVLFDKEASRTAWPEKELDQLLNSLVSDPQWPEGSAQQADSCPLTSVLAIRTFFEQFSQYLKKKGYSPCAWEVVKVEMTLAFSFLSSVKVHPERA